MSERGPKRKICLGLLLLAISPQAQAQSAPAAQCVVSCERHVVDRPARTRICGRCLLLGDQRAGWLEVAAEQTPFPEQLLRSALQDQDWLISWTAARVLGAELSKKPEAIGASWLVNASAADGQQARACAHLYRAGAAKGLSFAATRAQIQKLGGREARRAVHALKACESEVKAALELELYGLEPRLQLEAVRHLAALQAVSPVQVVVEAMKTRPPETDRIAADALRLDASKGGVPLGLSLLRAATAENQDRINRLVSVYALDIAKIAERRMDPEPLARKGVVADLRVYGPLAAPELEAMFSDEDLGVRLLAARAIVAGEGRSFEAAVRARVRPASIHVKRPKLEVQARWIELYGAAGESHCKGTVVREVATDDEAPEVVRAAGLKAYASCGAQAQQVLVEALGSQSTKVRAAAIAALPEAPRSPALKVAAEKALGDPSPEVRAAAIAVVAAQRQNALAPQLAALAGTKDAPVRAAAVRALGTLGASAHAQTVAERLRTDPDRDVRIAAVEALGVFGGPIAVGALTEAAAKDPESRVRHLADVRLKRLGFSR